MQTPVKALLPERVSSDQLLGNRGQLTIVHRGETYSLRVTRNGKLILTK
ncbi:MAG: hemin uptake protein HemP [Gammaproteobacteria bacterium]|nr:hemin uptake protein HemP [Gammaproteobacteria bacterium]